MDKQLALPERAKQSATRMAHLSLTDGVNMFLATEYIRITIEKFLVGQLILIRPCEMRKGVLLLTNENV